MRRLVAAATMVAWSYAVARTRFFTVPAELLVAGGIAALAIWAYRRGGSGPAGDFPSRSAAFWLLVAAAVTGLELFAFFHPDRVAYPTISSLLGGLGLDTELGKGVIAFAWAAGGAWLLW